MKRHKLLVTLVVILVLVIMAAVERYVESFKITDVQIQRIEIENQNESTLEDKNLYIIDVDYELNYSYGLRFFVHNFACTRYTANGSVDSLEKIIIEDSLRRPLNRYTEILNEYGGNRYGNLQLAFPDDSTSIRYIDAYEGWDEIYRVLQIGGPDLHSPNRYCAFYIRKTCPLPKYLKLIFKEREIEVKINNNPVVCRITEGKDE
jgi:hypothetical protein